MCWLQQSVGLWNVVLVCGVCVVVYRRWSGTGLMMLSLALLSTAPVYCYVTSPRPPPPPPLSLSLSLFFFIIVSHHHHHHLRDIVPALCLFPCVTRWSETVVKQFRVGFLHIFCNPIIISHRHRHRHHLLGYVTSPYVTWRVSISTVRRLCCALPSAARGLRSSDSSSSCRCVAPVAVATRRRRHWLLDVIVQIGQSTCQSRFNQRRMN